MKKKILLIGVIALMANIVGAVEIKVEKDYQLIPKEAYHPVINENGSMLLYTSIDYKGLNLYKIDKGEVVELSQEDGAGFAATFSRDECSVYYKTAKRENHLMMRDLKSYDIVADATHQVLPMSREDVRVISHKEGTIIKSGDRVVKRAAINNPVEVYGDYKIIIVERGGEKVTINPVSEAHSYMWVKLSPNGEKILFSVPYKGLFVCNLDGKEVKALGNGTYPAWYGNDIVVTTRSTHDGYHIETSQLIAIDLGSKSITELTTPQSMAEEAACAPEIGTIVYSNLSGEMRVLKIKVTE